MKTPFNPYPEHLVRHKDLPDPKDYQAETSPDVRRAIEVRRRIEHLKELSELGLTAEYWSGL